MTTSSALVAAIEGESAAVYAYGVIGGQTSGSWQRRARRALAAHEGQRAALQAEASEQIPVAPAYDLPFAVTDVASAQRLAVVVEERLVAVYADLAASSTEGQREQAVTTAMACASRAITWGGTPASFPGA